MDSDLRNSSADICDVVTSDLVSNTATVGRVDFEPEIASIVIVDASADCVDDVSGVERTSWMEYTDISSEYDVDVIFVSDGGTEAGVISGVKVDTGIASESDAAEEIVYGDELCALMS